VYKYTSVSADVLQSGLRSGSPPFIMLSFYVWFTRRFSGFRITNLPVYNGVYMSSAFKKSYKVDDTMGAFSAVELCHLKNMAHNNIINPICLSVEVPLNGIKCLPNLIQFYQLVQKLIWDRHRDRMVISSAYFHFWNVG
jgi:hypothetical protein